MTPQGYKRIIAWQKSIELTTIIYEITDYFPSREHYGLTSQMRRAAVSIPSNIAEGYRRKTTKDYESFFRIAFGSASELETQIIIAGRIGYLNAHTQQLVEAALEEVLKLLSGLSFSLRQKTLPKPYHPTTLRPYHP